MTRTEKFMNNTIASAAYQAIVMLVGLITPRIMLVAYGSEINGLVSSVTQFVSYFAIVEAGLSGAAVYSLYKPLADNDHEGISSIVTATRNFYYKSGFVFVSLLVLLATVYPLFVKTEALAPGLISVLVFVLGFSKIIDFFLLAKYRALLTADQRSYIISISSIISTILNLVIVIVLATKGVNIVLLKTVAISGVIVRSCYLYFYTSKKYSYLDFKAKPNVSALSRRWNAFYLQLVQIAQRATPTILVTFFSTLKNVSIYSIFNMVITGLSGVLDIFMSGLSASFGDILSRKDTKLLHKAYRDFEFTYYGLITVIYSVALVMIMPFVRIYTADIVDTNYNQPIIGILFILNAYLYNIKTPQGMLVISAGHYKETQVQSTIQALCIFIPGIILVPRFGVTGILIALIISNIYRDIDLLFYIPRKVTKLPVKESFLRIARSVMSMAITVIPTSFIFKKEMQGYFEWILYATIVFIYSTVVWITVSFVSERKQLFSVVNRFKNMLYSKIKRT
jgi:O-antigen/teichoic acid export membrane protein